jgi:hypothetical protein
LRATERAKRAWSTRPSRDVYVAPSERYADARASLLGDAAWAASREDTQRSLSLPSEPAPFLEQLGGELDDAYQRTREGLTPEHPIHELAAGELRVEQLDAPPEPAPPVVLRERVDALMPAADLPKLVLEIAAKTGFIDGFTNDQEPGAQKFGLSCQSPLASLRRVLDAIRMAQIERPELVERSSGSRVRLPVSTTRLMLVAAMWLPLLVVGGECSCKPGTARPRRGRPTTHAPGFRQRSPGRGRPGSAGRTAGAVDGGPAAPGPGTWSAAGALTERPPPSRGARRHHNTALFSSSRRPWSADRR